MQQKIESAGQEVVLANLSARQAKSLGLLTSGTYGQHGSISSHSVNLRLFLENKLRARTDYLGSTLYRLTWKEKSTPSGRLISVLRASVPRKLGNEFTSWRSGYPTPNAEDHKAGQSNSTNRQQSSLPRTAGLASYVILTDSGLKQIGYITETEDSGRLSPELSRWIMGLPKEWADCAPTETLSLPRKQKNS